MKILYCVWLLIASTGVSAQTASSNNSSSSATTSAQGNLQGITFNNSSPTDVTQNVVSSGTTRLISEYGGSYTIKNVPSVNGPNLTTSNDTCMGSTSGSANAAGFGFGFGSTWTDVHCQHLKMSRELWNKGMKAASVALDCMDAAAMLALEMTGTKCPQSMTAEERVVAFGPQASSIGAITALPRPVAVVTMLQPPQAVAIAAVPEAAVQPMPVSAAPAPAPAPAQAPAPAPAAETTAVPASAQASVESVKVLP